MKGGPMTARLDIPGLAASAGVASGDAAVAPSLRRNVQGDASLDVGLTALEKSISTAVSALKALSAASPPDSAAILDFQIEMLLDPAILDLAAERLDSGKGAATAWLAAMDDYIVGFEQSDDEIIRARAVDVIDIRNRVLDTLTGKPDSSFPRGSIYVGRDIEPSLFLAHDWSGGGGIALFEGSTASHVATLARSRGVPMVVGTGRIEVVSGRPVIVDGNRGAVIVNPEAADLRQQHIRANPPAILRPSPADSGRIRLHDGTTAELWININDPAELDEIDPATIAGIGLLRTEFLLTSPTDIFDEELQYAVYSRILAWARGKPVTIRLFDLGGDKALPSIAGDRGSFLGLRGIRLLLAKPDILRVQARSLLRAAGHGNLRIMLPMVTIPEEVNAVRSIIAEEAERIFASLFPLPPVGMMVEVPAAALMLDKFGNADFFSFGTNDLGQYLAAAARDNPAVSALHLQSAPAIYRLIAIAMQTSGRSGAAGICGDMASDPACLPELIEAGLRHFSVAPARLAAIKAAMTTLETTGLRTATG